MRRFIFVVGLFIIGYSLGVIPTQAQTYPNHSIQVVIPGAPGDALDIAGRLVIEELEKILKVPVVPINLWYFQMDVSSLNRPL